MSKNGSPLRNIAGPLDGWTSGPLDQESIGRMDFQPCAALHHCTACRKQVIGDQLGL